MICKKDEIKWVGAAYFPRGQKSFKTIAAKFTHDAAGVKNNRVDGLVFVTNQELRLGERKQLEKSASEIEVELLHLERIASILDSPQCYGIRLEFLDIEMTKEEQLAFIAARDAIIEQRQGALQEDVMAVQQAVNLLPEQVTAVFTGSLSNAGTATIAALDAFGKAKRNVKASVFISGATDGLGITPHWSKTTHNDLTTFVEQTVPSLGAQHALAGAVIENYPPTGHLGDVPEDCQGQLTIDSNGNDSGLTYICYLSYEEGG
mgnify:FL=1